VLPPQSWAFAGDVPQYSHDPQKAEALLEAAGYPAKNGVRLRLTMKTSTDETTRLLAAILQEQLAQVGVALDIRSYEFATFYADVVKGAYQLHSLRWIGANQDPDIFEYVFDTASFAPRRANRTFYSNPEVDRLIAHGRAEVDQQKRKQIYEELQHILAHDLPYINLWYFDNVLVHSRRVSHLEMNPSGNYDFLRTAELAPGN
jgi:peptide/nickel transport system substrate-binding protein